MSEDRAGLLHRIQRRVSKMLGADRTPEHRRMENELERYFGLAPAGRAKKRRRKIRQASQRRNR